MKTRNMLLITVVLLGTIALSSFILEPQAGFHKFISQKPETRAERITTVLKNKLSLNDVQTEKAYAINLRYAQLNQPYLKEANDDFQISQEMIDLNTHRRDELKAILTPEQVEKAEQIRQKMITRLELLLAQLKENDSNNH